eukprot:TRINITY_DN31837_c0_g1_i1.p1 TRINITY_DN31837_c0_g1~~TRINITY_DN31837_c0_g1_i1.p1  ORF type:complete len:568 (+),score=105.86 TRINITY_DN31837_c0_g1_i1:51-1706(+)
MAHGKALAENSLQELHKASLNARALRGSLRRLLAQLADSGRQCGHGSTQEQLLNHLREGVKQETRALETQVASSLSDAGSTLVHDVAGHSLLAPGVGVPGVPPRRRAHGKRKAESNDNSDLAPRLRLRIAEAPISPTASGAATPTLQRSCDILAATSYSDNAEGQELRCAGVAVLLSCGRLEVWESDMFSWHRTASSRVPLPTDAQASLAMSPDGAQLWLALASKSAENGPMAPVQTRLYLRRASGCLKLSSILQGPRVGLVAGPAPLPSGAVLALRPLSGQGACDVHILRWWRAHCEEVTEPSAQEPQQQAHLQPVSTFQAVAVSWSSSDMPDEVTGLWALPSVDPHEVTAKPKNWRFALGLRRQSAPAELQLRSGLGECLAVLELEADVICAAVPTQECCPPEALNWLGATHAGNKLMPFLIVVAQEFVQGAGEWCVAVVAEKTRGDCLGVLRGSVAIKRLQLHRMARLPANVGDAAVLATAEGLVAFRAAGSNWLLDWQQQRLQAMPQGWVPLALGPSTVVACREQQGEKTVTCSSHFTQELIFFELS